jgi:hypothetical protein
MRGIYHRVKGRSTFKSLKTQPPKKKTKERIRFAALLRLPHP